MAEEAVVGTHPGHTMRQRARLHPIRDDEDLPKRRRHRGHHHEPEYAPRERRRRERWETHTHDTQDAASRLRSTGYPVAIYDWHSHLPTHQTSGSPSLEIPIGAGPSVVARTPSESVWA